MDSPPSHADPSSLPPSSENEATALSLSALPTIHSTLPDDTYHDHKEEDEVSLTATELPLPSSSSSSSSSSTVHSRSSSTLCREMVIIFGHYCRKYTRGKYILQIGRLVTLGAVILSLYYLFMLFVLAGHTYQITEEGKSLGKIVGFGLKQIRVLPSTDNNIHPNANDKVRLHMDIHVRNGLYTSLIIRDLQITVSSVGLSTSMLQNGDIHHNIFSRTFDPALLAELNGDDMVWVANNNNPSPQDPWCGEPLSGSYCRGPEGSPTIAVSLQSTHIQQWLQTIVGLLTGMSIAPGYEPYLDRSNMADIRIRGKATIIPLALSPFGLQVTGEAKLSVSNALRYIGSAATGGTGRWSFTSFLNEAGVKKGGADAYGIYKDIATRIGTQTLSVRLPVDITGDLLGYYQWLRETAGIQRKKTNVIEASTGVGVNDPTQSGYNTNGNTCCCSPTVVTKPKRILTDHALTSRSLQTDTPITNVPDPLTGTSTNIEQLLTGSTEFPRPRPYSMTLGLAKMNTTGLLDHQAINVGILFCRTLTDIVSSTDAQLMKDLAMIWDTIDKTGSTRYVTPGTTVIGTRTSEDIYKASVNDPVVSPLETFGERILSQTQYRRPDICSNSLLGSNSGSGTKENTLFGVTSSSSPVTSTLRLQAVAGRQGYPNIYGALENTGKVINAKPQQYPGYLPAFAEISVAIDSTCDALGVHLSLNENHIDIARQIIRELIIGEDPSLVLPYNLLNTQTKNNRTISSGSPRVNRPVSPHGKARIWMCHPQQLPIGVVTTTVSNGDRSSSNPDRNAPYIHPLGSLIDGIMTCVLSPWLDAMAATVGGIKQEFNTTGWVITENELSSMVKNKQLYGNLSSTGNIILNDDNTFTTTTGIVYVANNRTEYFPSSTTIAIGSVCDEGSVLVAESTGTVQAPTGTGNGNTFSPVTMIPYYGWSSGISINHSYAIWNILGNNGKRSTQSTKNGLSTLYSNGNTNRTSGGNGNGDWSRISTTNSLKYDLSNGINYDPPWIYVRSTLDQGLGQGTGYGMIIEDSGITLPVSSTVTTTVRFGNQNSTFAQQICGSNGNNRNQRRRQLSEDPNLALSEDSQTIASPIPTVETPLPSPLPPHRNLGAANVPSLSSVREDSMGGLLAALASWYSDEIEPRHYEELVWDTIPLYNGYMSNDKRWEKDLRAYHRFQRSSDPCFQILHHDIAVMGSCCGNKTENMYTSPFLAEGARTLSLSGIVRLKQKTLRTILFRSIGDIQPIIFPTLLLKHIQNISFTNREGNRNDETENTITATTGIAAVARACAVTIPDYDSNNQPTQPYGNVNGAYFAAGDEYRIRLRIVLSVIDPELFWSAGTVASSSSFSSSSPLSSTTAARGLMDLFFNGPSLRSIDALSNTNVNDESAELLLRILQSQFSSTTTPATATAYTTTTGLDGTEEKSVPLPVAPNRYDPVLGNITGLLSGINWRLTLSSYAGTVNLLRERCLTKNPLLSSSSVSSLQCFRTILPPAPTDTETPTFYPTVNGKSTVSSGSTTSSLLPNSDFPLLADPLLYRLFSGLSLNLRLPTLRDTAEFVLGGDRSWPQQSSALLELMNIYDNRGADTVAKSSLTEKYATMHQIRYELATLVGMSDTLPITGKYHPYLPATLDTTTPVDTYASLKNYRNSSTNVYRQPLRLGLGLLVPLLGILAGDNPTIFGTSTMTGNTGAGFIDNDSLVYDAKIYGTYALINRNNTNTTTNSSNTTASGTTTISSYSNASSPTVPYSGTACPVTSYCLPPTEAFAWNGWYNDTASSYTHPSQVRGPLPSCTYRLPRFACHSWKHKNYSSLFTVPDSYCSNMIEAACEEWSGTCSYVSVIRTQDIPVLYVNLPETDLGQGSASIQIMPRCDSSDNEGFECDPWVWMNTVSTDAAVSLSPVTSGEPYPLHAGRLSFTITKTLSTGWQSLTANAAVYWCPQDTINTVSPNVFSYTTSVRSLPAARTVLIASLLGRTRLLTRITSRHRQFDYALPFRLFPDAVVSAHHVPILTLDDYQPYPIYSLPSTRNNQGIKATLSNRTLAQPYAFLRTHMYTVLDNRIIYGSDGIGTVGNSDNKDSTVYIGILLINTLPSVTVIDTLGDIGITALMELNATVQDTGYNMNQSLIMRIPFTYTIGAVRKGNDNTTNTSCSRLGITLMGPPKEIIRYGLQYPLDITSLFDSSTNTLPTDISSTIYYPTDGSSCGYATRSNHTLSLDIPYLAASTGLHSSVLTMGIRQRWITHISIPLLNLSNSETWLTKFVADPTFPDTIVRNVGLSTGMVRTTADLSGIDIEQDNTIRTMVKSWMIGHRMHYPGSNASLPSSSIFVSSSNRISPLPYSSSSSSGNSPYRIIIQSAAVIPSVKASVGPVRIGSTTIIQEQIQQHYRSLYNRLFSFPSSLPYNSSTFYSIGERSDTPEQYDQDTYIGRLFHLTQGYVGVRVWSVPIVYMKLVPGVSLPDNGTIGTVFLPMGFDTYIPQTIPSSTVTATDVTTNTSGNTSVPSSSSCPYLLPNGTCNCPADNTQTFQREPDAGFSLTVEYVAVDISNSSGAFILLLVFLDAVAIVVCCMDVFLQNIIRRLCFCCCRKPANLEGETEEEEDEEKNKGTDRRNSASTADGNITSVRRISQTSALTLRQINVISDPSGTSASSNTADEEATTEETDDTIRPSTGNRNIFRAWSS